MYFMSWFHLGYVCVSVCVQACGYEYGMVRWQQSKKGEGKNQVGEFISRPSYCVGYSPSVSLH